MTELRHGTGWDETRPDDGHAPGYCWCGRWARTRTGWGGRVVEGCPGLAAVEAGGAVPDLDPVLWSEIR